MCCRLPYFGRCTATVPFLVSCGKTKSPCFYFSLTMRQFKHHVSGQWVQFYVAQRCRVGAHSDFTHVSKVLDTYAQCGLCWPVEGVVQLSVTQPQMVAAHFFFIRCHRSQYVCHLLSFFSNSESTSCSYYTHDTLLVQIRAPWDSFGWMAYEEHGTSDIPEAPQRLVICTPTHTTIRRRCEVCKIHEPHYYCHKCGDK